MSSFNIYSTQCNKIVPYAVTFSASLAVHAGNRFLFFVFYVFLFRIADTNACCACNCCKLKKSNDMQQYADIYLLLNYCACFMCPSRPSSGVHKTVVAASGTVHTIWGASKYLDTAAPRWISST